MLEFHEAACPHKTDLAAIASEIAVTATVSAAFSSFSISLEFFKFTFIICTQFREITPLHFSFRICSYDIKIACDICSGAQKVDIAFSISRVIMIFSDKSAWAHRLPASFTVETLTISDSELSCLQSVIYKILAFRSTPDNDITVIYQFHAAIRIFAIHPYKWKMT